MCITDDYSFGTSAEFLNSMTDEEAKEYIESIDADYWVDEYKSNPDLM